MKPLPTALLAATLLTLTACASAADKPRHTRGWIGGQMSIATNDVWTALSADGGAGHGAIYGLPEGLFDGQSEGQLEGTALLVETAHPMTPLGVAGIAPGDLILSMDGAETTDPLELREAIEGTDPGSVATLRIWRDGETYEMPVTVGTETYFRQGTLRFGIGLPLGGATLDLWPFDDGIDILSVVRAKWGETRHELHTVRGDYVRKVHGDDVSPLAPQETIDIFIGVLGVGSVVRVEDQSVATPAE